jgi:hypothetical protein
LTVFIVTGLSLTNSAFVRSIFTLLAAIEVLLKLESMSEYFMIYRERCLGVILLSRDFSITQVSEVVQGSHKLKPQYLKSLEVEQWPFYTDAQKQMLKRCGS